MRVVYSLKSRDLNGVAAEAAWAESIGYDGIAANETAHDPFLPLAVAATTTNRVTLETHVAIAFPRSPWCWPIRPAICKIPAVAGSASVWEPR